MESIHVAAAPGAPMPSVTEVRAEAGRGLVGDRYRIHREFRVGEVRLRGVGLCEP